METSAPTADPVVYSFRNRQIRPDDVAFIKATIVRHGALGRSHVARLLCEAWGWRQPNGRLKDMACRDLLLRLEERGLVELPPRRKRRGQLLSLEDRPLPITPRPITACDLAKVEVTPIVGKKEREAWRILVDRFHYLGCGVIPGEQQLYFARVGGEIVACIGWSAAALHCPLRDAHIGWDFARKRERLPYVANNQRFVILPWVRVKGLASRVLGLTLRRLSRDWQKTYAHPIALAETFVDVERFEGTSYRAANWMYLGITNGRRRKRAHTYEVQNAPKAVYVYPLHRRYRDILLRGRSEPSRTASR
jgi:hypothetical protein